jgi:hypothetical protein
MSIDGEHDMQGTSTMIVKKMLVVVGFSITLILTALTGHAQESENNSLVNAITSGDAHVGLRYRYEFVDQDGFSKNANASTLRLRLNYKTGNWRNWSGFVEFDYLGELLLKDFNNLGGSSPDRDQYPVVADPKGPDLNQLYLDYSASPQSKLRLGRQRIVLDNHRFVGDVGWRQNIQTFDGLGYTYTGWKNTEVFYSYVTAVQRIFGNAVPRGRHDTDTHLLNVRVELSDDWTVIPYYYYIDNDDVAVFSTATLGARLTGNVAVGENKFGLVAEIATQSDAANNPVNYDAAYFNLGATWILKSGLSLGLAWESLGGDQNVSGAAFRTPLATLHAFQGWADKFLVTPGAGIDDVFATVKYKVNNWNFTGVYHDFSAESGSVDYGSEIDIAAGRSLGDRYGVLFKAAFYDADQHATDTSKFWIMLTANY